MADLYSIIPGLQPTAQELLEAELLAKQILEAKFPDLDLREGTGLRDLVLRPNAILLALCKKAIDQYFTQHTLKGVDNVTPPEIVDAILSNWFLTRNIGIRSVISARLYFARRKNVSISSDVYFSTDNTLKFFPVESSSFSANVLVYDSFSDEYYVDVDLIAEKEGRDYNLGSGSLLYFSNFDPYFLRAEINYLKNESIDSETNLEFITRAQNAISTRNNINVPSIDANLRSQFNYIRRLLTIGMGDNEMIRDQLKAVFEDEDPRTLTSLTSIGTTATAVLPNHGYNSGQRVEISAVSPVGYNGEFIITVVDTSTFTYALATSLGPVTTIPQVKAVNLPLLMHNGGMVDVFCSDKLAMSIVQLTTDEFGKANLTGPIYEFSRSGVTGGDEDDTIPVLNSSGVASIIVAGTTATVSTTDPHNFLLTDTVTISGAKQEQTLTSLTYSGLTATATKTSHGYQVGNVVKISGATPAGCNGTFTISAVTANTFNYLIPVNIVGAATGTIKAEVDLLNGAKTLTSVGGSTFTFTLPQASAVAVTGTITATSPTRYNISNEYIEKKNITNVVAAGKEALVTLNRHGYSSGRYVTISGSSVAAFNGTWRIKEVVNLDQFKFDLPVSVNNSTNTGVVSFVTPWYDYGFSQRQSLVLDFGQSYANKTASFNIKYFQNLESIQSYLDAADSRVLCGDYLARGFNFYLLTVEVTAYNGAAPNASQVNNLVNEYLTTLEPGANFVMTDMVTKLRLNGITNIQNPPKVTFKRYTRDLSPVETGLITDILDPNDRTSVFLLDTVLTHAQNITVDNTPVVV